MALLPVDQPLVTVATGSAGILPAGFGILPNPVIHTRSEVLTKSQSPAINESEAAADAAVMLMLKALLGICEQRRPEPTGN